MDYQTEADLQRHRLAGRAWVAGCGLDVDIDQIIPVVGGQHGIFSALMALLQSGDLLLMEALTYTPVLAMAQHLGLQTGAVAMDDQGIVPEAFETWCKQAKPKALYITPTLQAPTTVTLSQRRRSEIAAIAELFGVIIIEDDVFGPLKRDKPAPIASFAPEMTVYVTSLSKAVAPGLRVGFLAVPKQLVGALHQSINVSLWMTPPITLEIASLLIEDGTAVHLAERQQKIAVHRQGIAEQIIGLTKVPPRADGFHIWMPLPEGWRADAFASECRRKNVLVSEGRGFAMNAKDVPEAIRICVSHEPDEQRLLRGLEAISAVLRQKPTELSLFI